MTPEEAQYLEEICDRYGEEAASTVLAETELSMSAACEWAIVGHTVDGSLTVDEILAARTAHIDRLRTYIQYVTEQYNEVLRISRMTAEAILESNGGSGDQ